MRLLFALCSVSLIAQTGGSQAGMFNQPTQVKAQQAADVRQFNWQWPKNKGVTADLTLAGAKTATFTSACPLGVFGTAVTTWATTARITSVVDSGTTATLTFVFPHGMTTSSRLTISGVTTDTDLNGTYAVVSVPTTKTLTITTANVTDGSYTPGNNPSLSITTNNHYIRISGGVGTAENVLITGGTCSTNLRNGTITFTTANTHTGTWTIGSATGGLQEAVKFTEAQYTGAYQDGGAVLLGPGKTFTYAPTTLAGSPAVAIYGNGQWGSMLYVDSSFTTGDVIRVNNSAVLNSFFDLHIARDTASTSGAGIHCTGNQSGTPVFSNVKIETTYVGLWMESCSYARVVNYDYLGNYLQNPSAKAGIWISDGGSDMAFTGGRITAAQVNTADMVDHGILVEAADGITFSNYIIRAEEGVTVFGSTGSFIGSFMFTSGIIDNCRKASVAISQSFGTTPSFFGNILFTGNHIVGGVTMENNNLVSIDTEAIGAGVQAGIYFTGNLMANGNLNGIKIYKSNGVNITGNQISNNDALTTGGSGIHITDGNWITITGNLIQDATAVPKQDYGIYQTGTGSYINITGNTLYGNVTTAMNLSGTLTNSVAKSNIGADTVVGSMTDSAGVLALGGTQIKTYSIGVGTGTATSMTGAIGSGDTRVLICPTGYVFSAAGGAGGFKTAFTTTYADQVVTAVYNAGDTKWNLSAAGN